MSDANQKTIATYSAHVQDYINGTPQSVTGYLQVWIDKTLELIPKNGMLLELGSAFGRDAEYIEKAGYKIQRTDATKPFVELLQKQGYDARVLNAITDNLGGPYDLVFADAVLLHFTVDEFEAVIRKVRDSLKATGVFAFSVKQGTGSEWSDAKVGAPRFFQYWDKQSLKRELKSAGYSIVELAENDSGKWLHIIAKL